MLEKSVSFKFWIKLGGLYKFEVWSKSHRGLLNFQYFIKYHDLGKISIILAIKTKIYNRNYFGLLVEINYDGHFNSNNKINSCIS